MKRYGLIGYPLTHSFSQKYFTEKFAAEEIEGCSYELFPLENIDDIRLLFEIEKNLCGLNVTIPYKESVIEYLDNLDPVAAEIGAVNCIAIDAFHKTGYNTDWLGFIDAIKPYLEPHHTHALVLGTGGAAKAVKYACKQLGIETVSASRNSAEAISYQDIDKNILAKYFLIINTTPVGMFPEINTSPDIPYSYLTAKHLVFDLIYNPEETAFMRKAKQQGAKTINGYNMLVHQAEHAWKIWNAENDSSAEE